MELGPSDLHHLGDVTWPRELQLYLFGMGLIVRTGVEPSHE
jgi:hypothetical protein